jgi:sortase A
VTFGLFGAIILLAFAGLALALTPFAPRMVQLAATEIQTVSESPGEYTARETKPATETTARTTARTTSRSAGTISPADEPPASTTPESTAEEPEEGAGDREDRDPKDGESASVDGRDSGEADSATDRDKGDRENEAASGPGKESSSTDDGKESTETGAKEKPRSEEQTGGQDKKQKREQAEAEAPAKQEQPEPPVPANKTMSLSVPRLAQVQGDTVLNSDTPGTMAQAAMKLPSTGFPWQEGANTYIAGHRIGWEGTASRYQFYNLPAMRNGDAVYLTDANGTTYEYRVTEKFAVNPSENWVTDPIAGRDMITLQTCTDSVDPSTWWDITPKLMQAGPNSGRLVVRADKVATYPA